VLLLVALTLWWLRRSRFAKTPNRTPVVRIDAARGRDHSWLFKSIPALSAPEVYGSRP